MNGTRLNFTKPSQAGRGVGGVADPLVDRIRSTFQGTVWHVLQIRRRQVIKLSQACMQVDFGCVQYGFCRACRIHIAVQARSRWSPARKKDAIL